MDFDALRIFCATASELSVTAAAARLGRVPSNVTTRIQQLELDLGTDLFVRTGKRMALSVAGERFHEYAQKLLALEGEARHVVTGGTHGGTLRIGSMETTAASRLPSVLAQYHARHPATRLELKTAPSRQLIEQVRTGKLDCALAALPPSFGGLTSMKEMGLSARAIWSEDLQLLLPASEIDAKRAVDVRTRSLAAFPQGCTYRTVAEDLLGTAGSTAWLVQEMASFHAMIACVAAGACVTLLPESAIRLSEVPVGLRKLPAGKSDTLLIWRDGYDVPAFRQLLAQLPALVS